jgi:hypothetical protein
MLIPIYGVLAAVYGGLIWCEVPASTAFNYLMLVAVVVLISAVDHLSKQVETLRKLQDERREPRESTVAPRRPWG